MQDLIPKRKGTSDEEGDWEGGQAYTVTASKGFSFTKAVIRGTRGFHIRGLYDKGNETGLMAFIASDAMEAMVGRVASVLVCVLGGGWPGPEEG